MQALIELLAGLIALLAAAALAQFGVVLDKAIEPEREVRRVSDCGPPATSSRMADQPAPEC